MKKLIGIIVAVMFVSTACDDQSYIVERNLTQEADNFNIVRQLTVINGFSDEIVMQMTGRMSITADMADRQLEILVEEGDGIYKKHFVGLSDNTLYLIEDVTGSDVDQYNYTLNFNPKMLWPYKVEVVD